MMNFIYSLFIYHKKIKEIEIKKGILDFIECIYISRTYFCLSNSNRSFSRLDLFSFLSFK